MAGDGKSEMSERSLLTLTSIQLFCAVPTPRLNSAMFSQCGRSFFFAVFKLAGWPTHATIAWQLVGSEKTFLRALPYLVREDPTRAELLLTEAIRLSNATRGDVSESMMSQNFAIWRPISHLKIDQ